MKNKYLNLRTRRFILLFATISFFSGCEEDLIQAPDTGNNGKVFPIISDARVEYNEFAERFFLEATVSDPQGFDNIDSVSYEIFESDSTIPLYTGKLLDDGLKGDIIINDGRYSAVIDSSLAQFGFGDFIYNVSVTDLESNKGDTFDLPFNFSNFTPTVTLFSVTDSVAVGDTIFIEVAAADSNGLSDILSVTYDILVEKDSSLIQDSSFLLRDDGKFGDKTAEDGIYSVSQPTDPTGNTGKFTFLIRAEDFSGLRSDLLEVPVVLTN